MTVERPIEIELKYAVADRTIGERLLNAETLAGFRAIDAPRPTQHEDRYIDSADGALARAGFAARLRTSSSGTLITVKSIASGDGSLHQREELEGPADRTSDVSGWPSSAARALILELCGDAPLVELVTVRQFRRRRDLELPTGDTAVELSLDEVDVVARGRVVERFLELELELKRGSVADLAPLQALLDGHHGLTPAPGSKLERALQAARRSGTRRPSASPRPARSTTAVAATVPAPTTAAEVAAEAVAEVPAKSVAPPAPEVAAEAVPPPAEVPAKSVAPPAPEVAAEAVPPPALEVAAEAEPIAAAIQDHSDGREPDDALPEEADEDVVPESSAPGLESVRAPVETADGPRPSEDGPVEGPVVEIEGIEDAPELIEEAAAVESIVLGAPPVADEAGLIAVGKTPGVTAEDLHAEAGRKVLRFHLARMIAREDGTRKGEDPEELHAMRVSTRRMRAAWRVFGDGFRPDRTTKFRRRLRTLAARLGAVRDLDVLIEATEAFASALPPGERDGLDPLLATWREQRDAGRRLLIELLDSNGFRRFVDDYRDFVLTPGSAVRPVEPTSPHRVRDTAGSRIWAAYEHVRAYESVLKWADVPTLHQLRIEAKRLRYTLEFVREAIGPEAPALISRVVALQDHLGAMNDAEVAAHMARAYLVEHAGELTDSQASAISRYLVFREREVARLKRTVGVPWRSVAGLTFRRALGRTMATL